MSRIDYIVTCPFQFRWINGRNFHSGTMGRLLGLLEHIQYYYKRSLLKIDFSLGFGAEITSNFSGSVGSTVALFRCWDSAGASKTCWQKI